MVLINYLFLLIFEKETKCCFEPFFLVEFGMASCLARLRKKMFLVGFVVLLIMMAIFFGTAPFLLLLNFVISLSFFLSWVRIALTGLVVFFGMVGFLVSLGYFF